MERDSQHGAALRCLPFYGSHEYLGSSTSLVRNPGSIWQITDTLGRDVPNLEASRTDLHAGT
jgi:hypothetical protein